MPSQMSRLRFSVCLLIGVVIAATIYAVLYARLWESVVERAHRLCAGCGLGAGEVDGLIETMRAAGRHRTRAELFEAWVDTYKDEERRLQAMDLCRSCTEAVLDAAGR